MKYQDCWTASFVTHRVLYSGVRARVLITPQPQPMAIRVHLSLAHITHYRNIGCSALLLPTVKKQVNI
jgi:hypothetical protein